VWVFVWDSPAVASDIVSRMVPPASGHLDRLWLPLSETVNIAARRTLPLTPGSSGPPALLLIVASRSIRSLIWALLLVAILGPGVLAGIIAIALRSIGFIGKLLYEAIEEIDRSQVEAVTPSAASPGRGHGLRDRAADHAGAPASASSAGTSTSAIDGAETGRCRWDRPAASRLAWPQVTMILITVLATVIVSEWVSAKVRRAII